MIIALTGTPGTGKTIVSSLLTQHYSYNVLSQNDISKQHDFYLDYDQERQSKNLDIDQLDTYLQTQYHQDPTFYLIEGHATQVLESVTKVIILRCHPHILKNRLQQRNWSEHKIQENIESEALDIILLEALDHHPEEQLFEIDTSNNLPEKTAEEIHNLILSNFRHTKTNTIGRFDWSESLF